MFKRFLLFAALAIGLALGLSAVSVRADGNIFPLNVTSSVTTNPVSLVRTEAPVTITVTISNPWNIEVPFVLSVEILDNGGWGREIYPIQFDTGKSTFQGDQQSVVIFWFGAIEAHQTGTLVVPTFSGFRGYEFVAVTRNLISHEVFTSTIQVVGNKPTITDLRLNPLNIKEGEEVSVRILVEGDPIPGDELEVQISQPYGWPNSPFDPLYHIVPISAPGWYTVKFRAADVTHNVGWARLRYGPRPGHPYAEKQFDWWLAPVVQNYPSTVTPGQTFIIEGEHFGENVEEPFFAIDTGVFPRPTGDIVEWQENRIVVRWPETVNIPRHRGYPVFVGHRTGDQWYDWTTSNIFYINVTADSHPVSLPLTMR